LTTGIPRKIDHALFGYAEGHRQLASTVRLPSQDMYHLGAASDLASDVKLDPAMSYVTGLPLVESRHYALIRTWAAPEMPRPGCVWSHVLLLDESILATQADMSGLFSFFQDPRHVSRSFYSQPLTPDWRIEATSSSQRRSRAELVSEIIGQYYSHSPTFLTASAGAEALEAAIAAVWSQQWPRLRMEFSFRTAQFGARPRRSARYDVQVAFPETGERVARSEWVDTATDDASGGEVTPLRRFLWRYGRDMKNPRDRFRLLVETFLVSERAQALPMAAAVKVFDEVPEEDDGAILKNDILGFDTNSLSICPPLSFLDVLRLLDMKGADSAVDVSEMAQRFGRLSAAEVVEVVNFAAADGNRLDRLRDPIVEWTISRADDEIVNSVATAPLRMRILTARPDLVTARAVADLAGPDLSHLFAVSETSEVMATIIEVAVRRDLGEGAVEMLKVAPALTVQFVIDAARKGELHQSWRRPVANSRDVLLDLDLLKDATGLADVLTIVRLINLERSIFALGRSSKNWATRWNSLRRDVSEQDVLDIESDLLVHALEEASQASWDLVGLILPELRATINARPLGGNARQTLDRSLPSIGYDNWDLNRRILLALHALQKRTIVDRPTLSRAGLADIEIDFVFVGPGEPKRRIGFFWWLD